MKLMDRLHEYDAFRTLKDRLRPLKHLLYGTNDINHVLKIIQRARTHPVRTVLDVGAARGDMTLKFLRAFPEATVHCFEPQSRMRRHLQHRLARYDGRVQIYPCAVSDMNGTFALRLYQNPESSSFLRIQKYMTHDNAEIGIEEVPTVTLDKWTLQTGAPHVNDLHVDFMKIDVEGAELEVLHGARRTLSQTDNVFVEISPLRKGPKSDDYIRTFECLHVAEFTFLGTYGGDYWLSRDAEVLRWLGC